MKDNRYCVDNLRGGGYDIYKPKKDKYGAIIVNAYPPVIESLPTKEDAVYFQDVLQKGKRADELVKEIAHCKRRL